MNLKNLSINKRVAYITLALLIITIIFAPISNAKKKKKLPWTVGEKLTFSIRWGMIACGYAHMQITEKLRIGGVDGIDAFRIVSTARSAQFFDTFYKVRDRAESYMDAEKLRTVRYEQSNREGGYKKDLVIIYDYKHMVAYEYDKKRDPDFERGKKFEITEHIQDILSSLYYLRTKDLKVGESFEFDVGTGKKNWPLIVEVRRKEKIKVPAGKFKTFVVVPKLREEGLFKAKGEMEVWVTADKRRIPVKMRSKIPIGSITGVLLEYKIEKE